MIQLLDWPNCDCTKQIPLIRRFRIGVVCSLTAADCNRENFEVRQRELLRNADFSARYYARFLWYMSSRLLQSLLFILAIRSEPDDKIIG